MMIKFLLLLLSSFVIVALGQPDVSSLISLLASTCGFALFFLSLFSCSKRKTRFLLSFFWFSAVQSVQLFWLATPEYQGAYIFFVYGGILLFLGLQFAFLSLFFPMSHQSALLNTRRILFIASLWTLIEWSRLYILCGFVWNPIGLSMTAFPISSQMASIWGVFGLSFWVCLVNLLILRGILHRSRKEGSLAIFALIFPFLFGWLHMQFHEMRKSKEEELYHTALIQTAMLPHEKSYFHEKGDAFVSPYVQWKWIVESLEEGKSQELDLIVMPEFAVPFSAKVPIYSYEEVEKILSAIWQEKGDFSHLLIPSLSETREVQGTKQIYVNNLFWAQAISDHYGAEVVIGLDDTDRAVGKHYNAAFHLMPEMDLISRYEKQVLLPLAEYLPFSFLKPLVARYGIVDFFTHGRKAKIFRGKHPLNVSICYEECFGYLIRRGKLNGAKLFVNITNDAWYPFSRLPLKHFIHGKLRAIENGIPLVRACNTGLTGAIDSLGHVVDTLGSKDFQRERGALFVSLNLYSYQTIYTYVGDYLIVAISLFFLWRGLRKHSRCFPNRSLIT